MRRLAPHIKVSLAPGDSVTSWAVATGYSSRLPPDPSQFALRPLTYEDTADRLRRQCRGSVLLGTGSPIPAVLGYAWFICSEIHTGE